jgi:hypothetical protein
MCAGADSRKLKFAALAGAAFGYALALSDSPACHGDFVDVWPGAAKSRYLDDLLSAARHAVF